jgi:hypothetical protein
MAEGEYNLEIPFEDNLRMFKGKRVNLTLSSGQVVAGLLKDVKGNLVHLEKIAQRDFYDALIKVETICAMDAQFRGFDH